ncbi:MAG TPA: peptide chain release factor N(5)-glutamine methyltransferase [Paracoccaceae bacterium]|nr:peptide chain release factor N(5)-glutamine methyltransferase [Paracoccaceae bacterium]
MTTLRQALVAAAARLAAAGVPDPQRDARLLLAHTLGLPPDRMVLLPDRGIGPADDRRIEAAVAARAARQPVAQILGRRAFWRHDFRVTPDVLDPRPETEVLVAQALKEPFARVLDLGTGSGAILLSLLADMPGATGLGTDTSEAALAVAGGNARALGLADRAAFRHADWFAGVAGRFDLIVSNPPYLAEDEIVGLAPEVRDWEPRQALTPGGDGLDAYRAIAAGSPAHLAPGGRLMVEIGPTQGAPVAALLVAAGLAGIAVLPDLDGRDRVVTARSPG